MAYKLMASTGALTGDCEKLNKETYACKTT